VAVADALAAFDRGARMLEDAYRELWESREAERGSRRLEVAEALRDLLHELRNPLGGVRGLAALLRREFASGGANERAARLLERIEAGLDSVDAILNDRTLGAEDRADAATIVREAASLAQAADRANGGDVRFQVRATEGVELPVASAAFREIVANLVRNAAEACRGRGLVRIALRSTPDELVLDVEDDGCGLPHGPTAELVRRGFSTKGPGRGRGLAVVDERVRTADGTLELQRRTPGCAVRVRLPRGNR
jgi:signal transduction histidine kinase